MKAIHEFRRAFFTQCRVIGALVMREVHSRYGRENIGFLWMIVEPMLFTFGIVALRSAIAPYYGRGTEAHGLSLAAFLITGYMPFLLFRHVVARSLHCVRQNLSLLYHRSISLLDLYIARFIVEFCGVAIAFVIAISVMVAVGLMKPPANLGIVYVGWLYMAWFGFAFGLIVGSLSEMSDVVDRMYQPLAYLLIIVSGCFYMADWLPAAGREFMLTYNPLLHIFETLRGGYFGPPVKTYQDISFLTTVCGVMTFAGLLLLARVRRRIVVE